MNQRLTAFVAQGRRDLNLGQPRRETWQGTNAMLAQLPARVMIGVMAINASDTPQEVEFSELKLTKGEAK
jgi:hypothetical protein